MFPDKLATTYHYVLDSCEGEPCSVCHEPAKHKVEEVIDVFDKAGQIVRHPMTAYLCCKHFGDIMGNWAKEVCESTMK